MKQKKKAFLSSISHLHVSVLVDEADALLQAPEAACAAARNVLEGFVTRTLSLLLDVRQDCLDHLQHGKNTQDTDTKSREATPFA